jgi:hypothetical protein
MISNLYVEHCGLRKRSGQVGNAASAAMRVATLTDPVCAAIDPPLPNQVDLTTRADPRYTGLWL